MFCLGTGGGDGVDGACVTLLLSLSSTGSNCRCFGFTLTVIISGFGLIRFQPAFKMAPPTRDMTMYIPKRSIAIPIGIIAELISKFMSPWDSLLPVFVEFIWTFTFAFELELRPFWSVTVSLTL